MDSRRQGKAKGAMAPIGAFLVLAMGYPPSPMYKSSSLGTTSYALSLPEGLPGIEVRGQSPLSKGVMGEFCNVFGAKTVRSSQHWTFPHCIVNKGFNGSGQYAVLCLWNDSAPIEGNYLQKAWEQGVGSRETWRPGIGEACWESLPSTLCGDAPGGSLVRRW